MSATNEARFIGNLTKDPVGRDVTVKDETKRVLSFSIAVNTRRNKDNPQPPVYVDLDVWNKAAEVIENNLVKGDRIMVLGEYTVDVYEKDGETKYRSKFRVNDFEILKAKKWSDAKSDESDDEEAEPAPKKAAVTTKAAPKKAEPKGKKKAKPEPEPDDEDEDEDEDGEPF